MSAFERLRSFAAEVGQRWPILRSLGRDSGARHADSILKNWGIRGAHVTERLAEADATTWKVEAAEGTFVLRCASNEAGYLEYQLAVIRHLASADFPYEVPAVRPLPTGQQYLPDGDHRWLVLRFIEGEDGPVVSGAREAEEVGLLVGRYNSAMERAGFEHLGWGFPLDLFDVEDVDRSLTVNSRAFRRGNATSPLGEALVEHLEILLETHQRIPARQIEAVARLPIRTAYNDWHRYNRIARDGRVVGIIDFDSVTAAPRIVDFQNALGYVLIGPGPLEDRDEGEILDLAAAFARGYNSIAPLSSLEASLIQSVLVDRALWLVGDIASEVRQRGTSSRESLGCRLIDLTRWLSRRGDTLTGCLAPS